MTLVNPIRTTLPTNALERDLTEAHLETLQSQSEKEPPKTIPVPFEFPPKSPLRRDIEELAKRELTEAATTVQNLVKNSQVIEELNQAGVEVDEEVLSELLVPAEVFHLGSQFSFSGQTVIIRNRHEWTTFGFPKAVKSIRSSGFGYVEVTLEDDSLYAIAGGPGLVTYFTTDIVKPTLTRDPDLKAFKEQVLAAFKHLGVDTKKFFGV